MIEAMTKYSFLLLSQERESFLEELQGLGLVDITRSQKPVDEASEALLGRIEAARREIAQIESGCNPTLSALQAEAAALDRRAEALAPWGDYDRERLLSLGVPIHYYEASAKQYKALLHDPQTLQRYALQPVLQEGKRAWFVIAGDNAGFPIAELPAPGATHAEALREAREKADEAQAYARSLQARKAELPALREALAHEEEALARALASAGARSAVEGTILTFTGYAPTRNEAEVEALLTRTGAVWFKSAAQPEDNPPIKLRNNRFARHFEVLTRMYGAPAYDEFDPTPILGPFFLLFFAMCMGDAGYGLLLLAAGALLRRKKGSSLSDFAPLIMMLGGATFVIGIVLHTFFGVNLYEAAWVPSALKRFMVAGTIAGYDAQMLLAIAVGVVHICLATVVKALCYTRKEGFRNTLGTWGWTLLIVGGVIVAGAALTGVIDRTVTRWAIICLGCVSAVGIFLLNKPGRNPLVNIGAGLWDSYNTASGLLGDVLSYLRLFALGMAGGMLGGTFNMLGGMVLSTPVPGLNYLGFAVIVLLGHALNLALSCLGAFVHPLRLTFVEYFKNSGYQGSGRNYNPLSNQQIKQ